MNRRRLPRALSTLGIQRLRSFAGLSRIWRRLGGVPSPPQPVTMDDGLRRLRVGKDGDRRHDIERAAMRATESIVVAWSRRGLSWEIDERGLPTPAPSAHDWKPVEERRSPSGKTLFACSLCHVESTIPDAEAKCSARPGCVTSNRLWAQLERRLAEGVVYELDPARGVPVPTAKRRELV